MNGRDSSTSPSPPEANPNFYLSNETMTSECVPHDDELALLKRQVRTLSRRITAIEIDGQNRHQREVVLYTIGVLYFICKGVVWLHRNW
jgi:hypothetical protein